MNHISPSTRHEDARQAGQDARQEHRDASARQRLPLPCPAGLSALSKSLSTRAIGLSARLKSLLVQTTGLSARPAALPVLLAGLLLAAACSTPKDRARIEGTIGNVRDAEFYVYCEDAGFTGIDTIRIENGRFAYERQLQAPVVLTLLYPNFSRTYMVAEPGKTIKIEGDAARLGEADITGSAENELLTGFRQQNADKKPADVLLAASEFVRNNARSLAAIAVFRKYFADARQPDVATARSLLAELRRAQPRNADLAALAKRLQPQLDAARGQAAPAFSAVSTEGHKVSEKDFRGKPYIVAFWATWSNESRPLLRSLERIRKAHGEKVGIVACALDTDKRLALRRMQADSLRFTAVCDGQAFESPLVQRFGVRYVPGCVVVNRQGKVAGRDLAPAQLEELVTALLAEKQT